MSEEQKTLIELQPGERTWIGRYRVTRLQAGGWCFWSKSAHCLIVENTLPEAVERAQWGISRPASLF